MTDVLPYQPKLIRPVLDLAISHKVYTHGDLTVFSTWWLDTDGEAPWPCLVIVPTHKSLKLSYVPYVVTLDLCWKWAEETGDDVQWCMEESVRACDGLGIAVNFKNCTRIMSIIRDHLGDLLSCPPRPKSLDRVVADALLTTQEGKEVHRTISDAV